MRLVVRRNKKSVDDLISFVSINFFVDEWVVMCLSVSFVCWKKRFLSLGVPSLNMRAQRRNQKSLKNYVQYGRYCSRAWNCSLCSLSVEDCCIAWSADWTSVVS